MTIFLFLLCICSNFFNSFSQNIFLNIKSDNVENMISNKFISFAINPDVLLHENCSASRNERICMAKSLSPAYIQIDGFPISNFIIANDTIDAEKKDNGLPLILKNNQELEISVLTNFISWAKIANIVPIIKLSNSEKLGNGKWNSVSAMKVFSMAYKLGLKECIWELSNDCETPDLATFSNDLKSLKIVMDSFSFGKDVDWKLSGSLNKCDDKTYLEYWSDFIVDSGKIVDAINHNYISDISFLNMSSSDLHNMKNYMLEHNIHLWKTINIESTNEDDGSFQWLKTLGNSAIQGFTVVFKELSEEDVIQPSLSYYISLLHKKFVGPEVLKVSLESMQSENLSAYAHCAILPTGRVQGGITLFAINEDDKQKNISIQFYLKEDGGDVMQFILQKRERKIILNGEEMISEGDLKPAMIEAQPFKPLNLILPAKAIGFWIITNTNIKACSNQNGKTVLFRNVIHKQLHPDHMSKVLEQVFLNNINKKSKSKRSIKDENINKEVSSMETELLVPEINDEVLEEIMKRSAKYGSSSNFREFFESIGKLMELVELENEIIKIGNSVLQINETLENTFESPNESKSNFLENNLELPHSRFIRDIEKFEITTDTYIFEPYSELYENFQNEDAIETIIEGETKDEDNKSKLSKIVMPTVSRIDLGMAKESLTDLIERAQKIMKSMNETMKNREVEEFNFSNERAPLVALPIDPELQLKNEILKNKIKLRELKNKIKAKIAAINLKTKLKAGLPHKLLKRDAKIDDIFNKKKTNKMAVSSESDISKLKKNSMLNKKKKFSRKYFQDGHAKNIKKSKSKRSLESMTDDLNQSEENYIDIDEDGVGFLKKSFDLKAQNNAHAKNKLRIEINGNKMESLDEVTKNNRSMLYDISNETTETNSEIINITDKENYIKTELTEKRNDINNISIGKIIHDIGDAYEHFINIIWKVRENLPF